jgi:peptidoglycan/xylan/chitin deacetylase (PgdA/CDA1 family)
MSPKWGLVISPSSFCRSSGNHSCSIRKFRTPSLALHPRHTFRTRFSSFRCSSDVTRRFRSSSDTESRHPNLEERYRFNGQAPSIKATHLSLSTFLLPFIANTSTSLFLFFPLLFQPSSLSNNISNTHNQHSGIINLHSTHFLWWTSP